MNKPLSAGSAASAQSKFGSRRVEVRTIDNKLLEAVLTPDDAHARQLMKQAYDDETKFLPHQVKAATANGTGAVRRDVHSPADGRLGTFGETVEPEKVSHPPEYVLATGESAVHRLMVLDQVYGAGTREVLRHCGIQHGMRVADLGCGVGMVTRILADLVGTEGTAMGIDVSADQLEQARLFAKASGQNNMTFFEGDAMDTRLPHGCFDLVYCRFLLLHLRQPAAALRHMHDLLKPGGILVCEDGDLTAAGSVPASALSAFADLFGRLGPVRGVDYRVSRQLYQLVREAGFTQPNIRIHQPAIATGQAKSLLELSVIEASPAFLDAGLISREQLHWTIVDMQRATSDPKVLALMPPMTQVWAAKDRRILRM